MQLNEKKKRKMIDRMNEWREKKHRNRQKKNKETKTQMAVKI